MIPEWAGQYVGIPYERLDCYGLVRRVLREQQKIDLPPIVAPLTDEGKRRALAECRGPEWIEVPCGQERAFDVAEMELPARSGGRWEFLAMHLGVIVRPGFLLHTLPAQGAHVRRYGPYRCLPRRIWRWSV